MAGLFLLIDHNQFGIKAMMIDKTPPEKKVLSCCEILFKDLPEPPEIPGFIDPERFNAAMDSVAEKIDLKSCTNAVVLISPGVVHFRTISLPFHSEKKIQQILPFELEPLLPLNTETYISDFHLLDHQADQSVILTASIAESWVETYFQKLGNFGIQPKMISPAGYAVAVAFLRDHPQISDLAFLHITEDKIALILVHNRNPWTVRTLPGFSGSADTLADSIHQTTTGFCQRTGENIFFDMVVGFDPDLPDMDGFVNTLEKALSERVNPISSSPEFQKKGLKIQTIDINEWLTAVSPDDTRRCQVNFCKGKYSATSFFKIHFYPIAASIVLFFCAIGLGIFSTNLDNSALSKKIRIIDETALSIFTKTFPDQKRIQDPYLQMKANVQQMLKKTGQNSDKDQTVNKGIKVVDILSELSAKIAPAIDVEISSFLFNSGRLVLSGSTDNFNNVDKIKTGLESSGLFKKVDISSAAADKKGDRVNFKFNIDL